MNPPKLILLCHPEVLGSMSMPRYARMIGEGMQQRGFAVEYWTAPDLFVKGGRQPGGLRKWLGYLDSLVVYPPLLRQRLRRLGPNTLVVVTDHALGSWVPAVAQRPHVVHCHDFLAQRSALGEIPEHPTGASGRLYQQLIRRGYRRGRNFISISRKTQSDLHRFLPSVPALSEVVYNGLNFPFRPLPRAEAVAALQSLTGMAWDQDYFLHVGGNGWYKNRVGVAQLYGEYVKLTNWPQPLVMIGTAPNAALKAAAAEIPSPGRILFYSRVPDNQVHAAYAAATALIFPSLEEGFGWPIIEAQASGCPVITTDRAPMSEIGGPAAWYLPRLEPGIAGGGLWAANGALSLQKMASLSPAERAGLVAAGLANAGGFSTAASLDQMATIYRRILAAEAGLPR